MSPLLKRPRALMALVPIALGAGLALAPGASAATPSYLAAKGSGFNQPLSSLESRHVWNVGARPADDGIIVTRFFIPSSGAAGGLLQGDDRSFSSTADLSQESRGWLVWDLASGDVSLTMAPSTVGPRPSGALQPGFFNYLVGLATTPRKITALRVDAKSTANGVTATDDQSIRFSNDAFVERTAADGIRFKVSLLNSLTNKVPGAAWSADLEGYVNPNNRSGTGGAGGYSMRLIGNGYPAVESYYYPRNFGGPRTLFLRRVDPDKLNSLTARFFDDGGGFGALDRYSWFDCTGLSFFGGTYCATQTGAKLVTVGGRPYGYVSPDSYETLPGYGAGR